MASAKSVWGIDIGQCALKALKLRDVNGQLQAEAFDVIEHPKILSQPDADRKQLIRTALEQFLARNNVQGADIVLAASGQSSFARFVKLPPVDPKRIAEIVRFEAEQQIPFPIDNVIWRWQTFQNPDSPDVELGLFAMKKIDVAEALSHFADIDLKVGALQIAPLALHNFMVYDDQIASDGATLLADVGVEKTDLVVVDGARLWMRTIHLGGNNFTEALVKAFKLPFAKAEKLKRGAAGSKYARQIFQAMRPVFADLVQEIQRSIGFYTQLHRDTRFRKLIGLGNGFRLPGLQKFLEQNLNISVTRIDSYNHLKISDAVNAPAFTENVLSFAVAYGLAVQGLGYASVETNLLPDEVTRKRRWARKRPYWAAAAAALLVTLGLYANTPRAQLETLRSPSIQSRIDEARNFARQQKQLQREYQGIGRQNDALEQKARDRVKVLEISEPVLQLQALIASSVERAIHVGRLRVEGFDRPMSHQEIYNRILQVRQDISMLPPEARRQETPGYKTLKDREEKLLGALKNIPRGRRRIMFLENLRIDPIEDIAKYEDSQKLTNYVREQVGETTSDTTGSPSTNPLEHPAWSDPTAFSQPTNTDTGQRKKGFRITLIGRSPASEELIYNDLLPNLRTTSQELVKDASMEDIELVGFEVQIDREGKTLPAKAAQLAESLLADDLADPTDGGGRDSHSAFSGTSRPSHFDGGPMGTGTGTDAEVIEAPDLLFPDEESADDRYFIAVWILRYNQPSDDANQAGGPMFGPYNR